jgi:hypothetical protein
MWLNSERCRCTGRGDSFAFALVLTALLMASGVGTSAAAEKAPTTPSTGKAAAASSSATPKSPDGATVKPTGGTKSQGAETSARADSMTLRAGQSGTEFRSMTVEGEDRVHVDFGRPELNLDLDPQDVPGLSRGTALDVLDRTVPDLGSPLSAMSSQERCPFIASPWLRGFATGSIAKFRPAVSGVVRWKLLVADSRGETVASYDGVGDPPKEIAWDGRSKSGAPVTPGLTYSYVFEAHDRAGNKRNFVGQGFTVSAYRVESPSGQMLVMSGRDLTTADANGSAYGPRGKSKEVPPILLEVASWLNQSNKVREPVKVAVSARTRDQASALANRALVALQGRVIGDPSRIMVTTEITPDAPEDGVLRIGTVK